MKNTMKKLAISAVSALFVAVAVVSIGAGDANASYGCPQYNAYYNNGYSQTYCYPSYYPTPIIYTPPVIPVQTLYPWYGHPTYAVPTAPVYFQAPRQYYPYYQTPLYTYPRFGYGW